MAPDILDAMDTPKKRVLEALTISKGIVTSACDAAQIPRSTYYLWMNNDPEFKAAVDDIQEIALDFVEGKLFDKISTGDTIASIFYLKTKGKKRGYVERQEIEHSGNLGVTWVEEKSYDQPLGPPDLNTHTK